MPSAPVPSAADSTRLRRHRAGVLDIRNIIGSLLAVYGVILTLMGIFGDPETEKTGGTNANLWAGLVMLGVGLAFMAWARLRPTYVPERGAETDSAS